MAKWKHLRMLTQGVEIWNQWRKHNSSIQINLRHANFSYANLRFADLRHADLSYANLSFADLSNADLSDADLSYADLSFADLSNADLNFAIFIQADLSATILRHAILRKTVFSNANLRNADLSYANLINTNLIQANLSEANLSDADFSYGDLYLANLSYADLRQTKLSGTNLFQTDFTEAMLGFTFLGDIDLSETKGLETTRHYGPSTIGINTIYASKGNIPYKFMLDAGVPKDDIAYFLSLAGKAIDFYSCFISYSSQDKAFAERLHADLQAKGVRTWYAPEDLKIGEPILAGIDRGIQMRDKLLVVLSENSVQSKWVEHEVEAALYEEAQPDRQNKVLFPIRLDNTVMDTKVNWAYRIRQRHIGDFTQWKDHDTYQKAFDRLLRDLKQESES